MGLLCYRYGTESPGDLQVKTDYLCLMCNHESPRDSYFKYDLYYCFIRIMRTKAHRIITLVLNVRIANASSSTRLRRDVGSGNAKRNLLY